MSPKENLSILEVLESLNTLVEADSLDELEVTEKGQLISHKDLTKKREVYWVRAGANDATLEAIKENLKTVHKYLEASYKKMSDSTEPKRFVDGINSIMILVGEAAKKLEKFDVLFRERIPTLDEYKNLQEFYRHKVIKDSFKEFIKVPLFPKTVTAEEKEWEKEFEELLGKEEIEEQVGTHLLNDIEAVKRDHLYELFYLKNEAGQHFYTSELARNIKLACDFGEYAKEYFGTDPLLQIKNWEDKNLQMLAKNILKATNKEVSQFYLAAMKFKDMEIVSLAHSAAMALMLASNPRNLIRQFAPKGCYLYFSDFLLFLREIIENRDYQKFLSYSPQGSPPFLSDVISLISAFVFQLFTQTAGLEEMNKPLNDLILRTQDPKKKTSSLAQSLKEAYDALFVELQKHPSGPVFKALDLIRDETEWHFDPLLQGNIPGVVALLKGNEKDVTILRVPSPTIQEQTHHASINQEFRTFLGELSKRHKTVLCFNFQDRTSWREHARCKALEELSHQAEFAGHLTVVTLAKDTDFYNQTGDYHQTEDANDFKKHFTMHLEDSITGYHFPSNLKKELFPSFIEKLFNTIHASLFDNKENLSFRDRLDFIEIAYHFIELKIIEKLNPDYVAFVSKDSLDVTAPEIVGLLAFPHLIQGEKWRPEELEKANTVLFGPTLLIRERLIHAERFERLHEMLRLLETNPDALKKFTPLFTKDVLNMKVSF